MKIIVRVLAGVFVLAVAVVVAGVAIIMSIDPNEYRERLTSEVKNLTGRDLVIKGDLNIGISLIPTLVANDVTFSNASWGSRPDMASIKKLEGSLEVLPLLSGNIKIGKVVLVEPDILLEVAADGRANWDFSSASSAAKPSQSTPSKPSAASDSSGAAPTIPSIDSIAIDKARFRFNDMKAKQDVNLALEKVRIGDVSSGNKLKIEIAGAYNNTPFELKGTTDPIDNLVGDSSFAMEIEANVLAAILKLKGAVAKPMSGPLLGVDFSLAGKDLTATLDAAKALAPQLKGVSIPAIGSYDIAGRATGPASTPGIENLKFNLGNTDAFKLSGTGKGAKNTYSIDKFSGEIYGSDIAGSVVATVGGKVPEIKANLTSHKIDLADIEKLMKGGKEPSSEPASASAPLPSTQAAKGKAAANDGRIFPADKLPLDGLGAANATVSFKGDRVIASGTTVSAIDTVVVLNGGKLTIEPLGATVSEGRLSGKVALDASSPTPTVETNISMDKLNLGGMLKERGVTDVLTGKVSTKINAKGTGDSVRAIMASLNGETEVIMDEGRIGSRFVDMAAADLAKAFIPGGSGDARINCVVSRFDVKQGIATSKALLFDTDKMTISGGGTIDLRTERLDLGIEPQPKENSLVSLAVPLQVSGTLASPRVAPTSAAVAKRLAGLAIGGLTPLGIVGALSSRGSGEQNPCVAALNRAATQPADAKGQPKAAPTQQQAPASNNPVDALRGLFGGKK
jgi:uncharacterized protein involved in outer membrane biogenesis